MQNTTNLTINALNANNEYNLDLTAFAKVTYTKSPDYGQPNAITFNQVPTLTEIQNCLQTNINRIQELIPNANDDAYYDYIPDYISELLYFINGLYKNNLLNQEQAIPYIQQIQNIELNEFTLDSNPINLLNNFTC